MARKKEKYEMSKQEKIWVTVVVVLTLTLIGSLIFSNNYRIEFYGEMNNELRDSELFEDLKSGKSICFVGDSITSGSDNWGVSWYDPLKPYIEGDIKECTKDDWTTGDWTLSKVKIPEADIYVVALGMYDIRTNDSALSAETGSDYVSAIANITGKITDVAPGAKIYYIAPWPVTEAPEAFYKRRTEFANSLSEWCNGVDRIFIDPYPAIFQAFKDDDAARYMKNNDQPNIRYGVGLYSYAVLYQDHQRRV
ncbi:MAG: SGNH/GDSL hydrolase family protein [Clostridiales bacterium]|nr:SGNH/GDSL hydrolase family protein [Clostridiales bacterium]